MFHGFFIATAVIVCSVSVLRAEHTVISEFHGFYIIFGVSDYASLTIHHRIHEARNIHSQTVSRFRYNQACNIFLLYSL